MEAIQQYIQNIDMATIIAWGWKILAALLIFIIGRWVAKLVRRSVSKLMAARGLDPMLVAFLSAILYAILLVAVVIAAIGQLGIQTTPLIAVLGAAGLAVGLALQNSLGNFASGVMLVLFRPFTKGDFVEAGGTSGTVDEVGIFTTMLNTPDNRRVIVPNGQITKDTIKAHDKVLDEPEPVVWVMELADSSVNFAVRPWVASADYWQVRNELLEQLKTELEAAGCSIPFPQRGVHLHEVGKSSEAA